MNPQKPQISLDEIQKVQELSKPALDWLQSQFPPQYEIESSVLGSVAFPVRFEVKIQGHPFEWVVSELGSITLRLVTLVGNKKLPPPIFYLSVGKTESGELAWMDIEGNVIPFPSPSIIPMVDEKVKLYLNSIQS